MFCEPKDEMKKKNGIGSIQFVTLINDVWKRNRCDEDLEYSLLPIACPRLVIESTLFVLFLVFWEREK